MMANPKRIPYLFGIVRDTPGKFYLAYKLSQSRPARHEVSGIRCWCGSTEYHS